MHGTLKDFAFLEFSAPDANILHKQIKHLGFTKIKTHQTAPISFYQQNQITFIVNETKDTQAADHAKIHGPGACAMGFVVENVEKTYSHLLQRGAKPFIAKGSHSYNLPAIEAIGGSVIYLTDNNHKPYTNTKAEANSNLTKSSGLQFIDHLTHNVYRGNMDKWADFYKDLFDFHQIRYFNIEGQKTGLISRAMGSKNGKIRLK